MSKISTKNILKKIFKGKTVKKVKKKVSKKKVVKAKKAKKAKKIISKKIKKVVKKVTPKLTKTKKTIKIKEKTAEPKVDNLRISKTNEVKPEIKKVKKQETEKREYKIKIVEALWSIIYSNKDADIYETNLMRRLAGLLYIDNKTMGDIKEKIKQNLK